MRKTKVPTTAMNNMPPTAGPTIKATSPARRDDCMCNIFKFYLKGNAITAYKNRKSSSYKNLSSFFPLVILLENYFFKEDQGADDGNEQHAANDRAHD